MSNTLPTIPSVAPTKLIPSPVSPTKPIIRPPVISPAKPMSPAKPIQPPILSPAKPNIVTEEALMNSILPKIQQDIMNQVEQRLQNINGLIEDQRYESMFNDERQQKILLQEQSMKQQQRYESMLNDEREQKMRLQEQLMQQQQRYRLLEQQCESDRQQYEALQQLAQQEIEEDKLHAHGTKDELPTHGTRIVTEDELRSREDDKDEMERIIRNTKKNVKEYRKHLNIKYKAMSLPIMEANLVLYEALYEARWPEAIKWTRSKTPK